MENVLCFGDCLNNEELKSFYVRLKYNKDTDDFEEFYFHVVDGVEYELPIKYIQNGQIIQLKSLTNVEDMLTLKIPLQELNKRAEANNKTLLSYVGKNFNLEKIFCVLCNNCGTKYNRYMRFFSGCRTCETIAKRKKFIDFVKISRIKHNDKYIYNDKGYQDGKSKIDIFCTKCQRYFSQRVKHHLDGNGCPFCNESKGEMAIEKYLKQHGIRFKRFKKFDGLVHKNSLSYDFYLIDLNILIEYDGEHHFQVINYSKDPAKNSEKFEVTKLRDKIKNHYAITNNIPLLRIPYWDFDRIEELVGAFIKEHLNKLENNQALEM